MKQLLIGRNIAPGLKRNFVSESWQNMSKIMWDTVRSEARMKENTTRFRILASDKDGQVLKKARDNAVRAGVGEVITFQRLPVEQFSSHKKYGCIICNPPYGQRIGNSREVEQLFRSMGKFFPNSKHGHSSSSTPILALNHFLAKNPTKTGNSTMETSSVIFMNILARSLQES